MDGKTEARFSDGQVYKMLKRMYQKGVNDRAEFGSGEWESTYDYECEMCIHELFNLAEAGEL